MQAFVEIVVPATVLIVSSSASIISGLGPAAWRECLRLILLRPQVSGQGRDQHPSGIHLVAMQQITKCKLVLW